MGRKIGVKMIFAIAVTLMMICFQIALPVPQAYAAPDLTKWIIGGVECKDVANCHVSVTAGTSINDLQQHAEDTLPVVTYGGYTYFDSFVGKTGVTWAPTSGIRNEIRHAVWNPTYDNGDGTYGAYVQTTYEDSPANVTISEDDVVIQVIGNGWTSGMYTFHKIKLLSPTKLSAFTIGGTDCSSLSGVQITADRTAWATALTQTGAELKVADFSTFQGLTATPHGGAGVCIAKLYRNGTYVTDITNNSPKSILDYTKGDSHPWPKISNPENAQQIWYTTNATQTFQANDVILMRWYDGPVHQFYKVTLKQAVTGVTLDKDTLTLNPGGSDTLTAAVLPVNAANQNVTWNSSDTNVATVANGVVTAVAGGTATITVTTEDGGFTDTCNVTVNVPVTGVTLDKETMTLTAGGATGTLTATVAPADATDKSVNWGSSDTSVATVANGVVTPVAAGSATITVTTVDGGYTDTCAV
ncbi:MAG: Ig-like domain-containing protein, partial [Chitinophagales bacterium]